MLPNDRHSLVCPSHFNDDNDEEKKNSLKQGDTTDDRWDKPWINKIKNLN